MAGGNSLGKQFAVLFAASTASNLGDGVLLTAAPLLAYQLTKDPLSVPSVTAAAPLPWLLFGLFAGVIVDRTDRWQAMVTSDALRGAGLVAFAVIVLYGSPTLPEMILVVFALGVGETSPLRGGPTPVSIGRRCQ